MSFFKTLGNIGKGIAKGVLGVSKTAVNIAGNVVGIGPVFPSGSNGGAQQAAAVSIAPPVGAVYTQQGWSVPVAPAPSLLDLAKDALGGLGNALNGRTHVQVDANVGAGGRIADMPGTGSAWPSWLLPVAAGGAILLLMSGSNRRRY
jgi:hypothetical protein